MVEQLEDEVEVGSSGRLTIPVKTRRKMGLSRGDRVMVEYVNIGEKDVSRVGYSGRFTIPKDIRDDHEIEEDDEIVIGLQKL